MLKKILEFEGVEKISKETQKDVFGGSIGEGFGGPCADSNDCTATSAIPSVCCYGICIYTSNWQNAC